MKAYEKYINAKVMLFVADSYSGRSSQQVAADVQELLEFETEFARILTPDEERRNFSKLYNPRRLSDMNQLFPLVSLKRRSYLAVLDQLG